MVNSLLYLSSRVDPGKGERCRLSILSDVLRSVSGTYTTACTGSSEFISFIGQANNGVACLSHVESEAPRMRIDIQKAEYVTSFLFIK